MSNQPIYEILKRIEAQLASQAKQPMSFKEAAKYLQISESHLYRLTSKSEIPHYKPGGKKIYFEKTELDRYIFKNRVKPIDEIQKELDERDSSI